VWNNIFGYVLGGIGKIKLGMYTSILVGILNIPLAIFFVKNLNMGLYGVILSNISCLLISSIVSPIQVYYFIFSKNKNIFWEKLLE
jgi:Na+-driven multidrug efflux pump